MRNFRFAVLGTRGKLTRYCETTLSVIAGTRRAMTMTLARPLHFAMVCAAFLFITAIVIGAL